MESVEDVVLVAGKLMASFGMGVTRMLEDFMAFLNVDLDVVAKVEPTELHQVLDKKLVTLHAEHGDFRTTRWYRRCWVATYEVRRGPRDVDHAIKQFHHVILSLRGRARTQWQQATVRQMSIGIEQEAARLYSFISATSVARMQEVGCSMEIVVYPRDL
ncbi:MAG: hypothetical protein AB2A00_02360 [Myxococcota bacterium]